MSVQKPKPKRPLRLPSGEEKGAPLKYPGRSGLDVGPPLGTLVTWGLTFWVTSATGTWEGKHSLPSPGPI